MDNWYNRTAIFQWNANGLQMRCGDFRQFISKYNFPILAITEARVDGNFRLSNYMIYMSTRPLGKSRAMLCVRKDLPSVLLHKSSSDIPEYVICKVQIGKISVIIASIYMQPVTPVSEHEATSIFRKLQAPYVLCGDFNAHNALWGSDHCDVRGRTLETVIEKFDAVVLNDGSPTYLRGVTYCSCLDLTICSSDLSTESEWSIDVESGAKCVRLRMITKSAPRDVTLNVRIAVVVTLLPTPVVLGVELRQHSASTRFYMDECLRVESLHQIQTQ